MFFQATAADIAIYKNGSSYTRTQGIESATTLFMGKINGIVPLNVGDTIKIYAFSSDSSYSALTSTGKPTYMSIVKIN